MTTKTLFNAISNTLKPIFKNHDEYFISLLENWLLIAPKSWINNAYPVKFKWVSRNKAILILKPKSISKALNLNFESSLAIHQINSFFGQDIITKIVFINH